MGESSQPTRAARRIGCASHLLHDHTPFTRFVLPICNRQTHLTDTPAFCRKARCLELSSSHTVYVAQTASFIWIRKERVAGPQRLFNRGQDADADAWRAQQAPEKRWGATTTGRGRHQEKAALRHGGGTTASHLSLRADTHPLTRTHTHLIFIPSFATACANAMSDHSRRWNNENEGEFSKPY